MVAIPIAPGPAVQFDNEREGPTAFWLVEPSQQWLVTVPEKFDVFDVNVTGLTTQFRADDEGGRGRQRSALRRDDLGRCPGQADNM